eukprot:CAMPEP_0198144056 /NCGR_PEP_ID=MMETSP1443-20131203/12500_1 /TAXON_ID=186043 /ORGANISM="Entomoneis sp., Strain CCMP2396" /LENGTH=192 /DNA_ID=CAMNT_0043807389 /DNA_START=268 /DNA_END=846 /DNA_ORIENTATION=+
MVQSLSSSTSDNENGCFKNSNNSKNNIHAASLIAGTCIALSVASAAAPPALAVSGGGLDYANIDISGQDFSKSSYKNKNFTQVIAKATDFSGSNLQGCRFFKAYLVKTDFTGADIRGASLEDTSMDEALLRDVNAAGAYFSSSILDVKDLENADFTDAQFPPKTLALLCDRPDMKGVNPTTGEDTRDSAMCP